MMMMMMMMKYCVKEYEDSTQQDSRTEEKDTYRTQEEGRNNIKQKISALLKTNCDLPNHISSGGGVLSQPSHKAARPVPPSHWGKVGAERISMKYV
jgi:hypothetical protein